MNMATVADLTADMLMRGTTKHTRQQIKDELDRLKARVVDRRASQPQATATIETTRDESARACWRSSPRCCASPRSPPTSSSSCEQENLAAIEQQRTEPRCARRRPPSSGT